MATEFVGRQDELARLEEWWTGPAPRPALIWGRRRVGKTALLQRFAQGRRFVFHTGANRAGPGELAEFSRQVAITIAEARRDLEARPYHSWDEAFDSLSRYAESEPLLLVMDEFPEVAEAVPDITGILRAFLDRSHGRSGLRILLCGSAVRTMQAIQEYRSPLYGRFDMAMQLHPFRPHEAAEMLPDLEPADRAVVYGIVGGMPLYLSWWRQDASARANLMRLACTPDGRMLSEGDLVLATEAGQSEHMEAVLRAIATGRTRHNEIADETRIDPTRTLNDLITLRLIERLQPVTETARSRRRIYRITDNFLSFFLSVLSPFRGEIDRGLGRTVINAVTGSIDDHMGPAWEEAFRDHLRLRAVSGRLDRDDVVAIGPWWRDGGTEIDAVGLAGRNRAPFLAGEATWSAHVNAARIKASLIVKAAEITAEPGSLRYVVCGRAQVERADPDTVVVTAADIFTAR
jgi:AAA+ ATPase superfamily predicted ATPase